MAQDRVAAVPYSLVALLGQDGLGVAWRAYDGGMRREVALKQLKMPDGLPKQMSSELATGLEREGRVTGMSKHPRIVTEYEYDQVRTSGGLSWIVIDLIDGRSLDAIVRAGGRLSVETNVLLEATASYSPTAGSPPWMGATHPGRSNDRHPDLYGT
ncbi:MAG: serine/threonine protein kinase [Gemmatimonadales bacterium]|jgi:serine/threonine protein kinase|nr:serine/threonine protein kinase [Gemmatimonadales bacterium]